MRMGLLALPLALVVGGPGCTGDDSASTTTTSVVGTTTTASTTVTTTLPPTTTTTTLPPLVDNSGVGYGFLLGAADQTVALSVEFTDHDAAARGNIPEVSVLPDSRWRVELRFGRNLLFHLAGVVTPTDPRAVVDEVWPVVAGTITILEIEPASASGCDSARALLVGFEAVAEDGTRVHLGDFEVETGLWGCFPI